MTAPAPLPIHYRGCIDRDMRGQPWFCNCKSQGTFVQTPTLPQGAEGPPCIWCNAPTKRTGACFTCIACGSTTSC